MIFFGLPFSVLNSGTYILHLKCFEFVGDLVAITSLDDHQQRNLNTDYG